MSAFPVTSDIAILRADGNGTIGDKLPIRVTSRRHVAGAVALVLLAALLMASAVWFAGKDKEAASPPTLGAVAPATDAAVLPSAPADGVLTLVIPAGANAEQLAGGPGYQMPAVIHLEVGDTIVIRNDDVAPHMVLYAFLQPGETHERTFTEPGSEVYSSGCGINASTMHNFTTIFVSQ
jgi:hypothetical protein